MDNTNDDTDVGGTANQNHQHKLYRDLCEEYTPEGASHMASANLRRKGEDVEAHEIASWDKITRLTYAGKLDLAEEAAIAAAAVNAFTDAVMGRNDVTPPTLATSVQTESVESEEQDWDEDEDVDQAEDDDERPTLEDIFGCGDQEANEEAAADYIRKMQERSDD